ncbi:protein ALP1-like [Senna tora]|uniref:Protein ALP1-like n=1 Tax=Senna tora TaxID=362788 RepID=A0A834TJX1_9FABA|nr:protein ALP1-like [Senna tora]
MDEVTTETIGEIIVCMVSLMVSLHNCLMHEALTIGVHRNRLPSRSYTLDFHEKRAHFRNLVYSNDSNCYNVLRMYRATFDRLCSMLDEIGGLKPTKHMLVDEQVAMCLNVLAHHAKNRVIQWNFGRSGSTISKYFKAVLKAIIRLHRVLYKTPNPVPEDSTDPRWKWFKNCLGTLDGTHIRIRVHKDDQTRFRNRKCDLTINVLDVCSQDAQFIYVLSDRYYLVDAGYSNAEGFLTPYRGQRYHLNEWREGRHPTTPRECFNMRHSAARNVIERCFGMLKNRWAILRSPSFYLVKTHNMIVIACCLLHNLIRRENVGDPLNDEAENLDPEPAEEPVEEHAEFDGPISTVETRQTEEWIKKLITLTTEEATRLWVEGKPPHPVKDKDTEEQLDNRSRMVYGTNTSGFRWDEDRQMVVADRDVWDAYIKSHSDASRFRYKPFPHLIDLTKVWGKDRATEGDARDAEEINDQADEDGIGLEGHNQTPPADGEQPSSDEMTQADCEAASTSRKRKRSSTNNDVIEGFKEITEPFLHRLDKIADGMNMVAREKALD